MKEYFYTIPGNPLSDNHLYGHRAIGKRVIKYMTSKGKEYQTMAKEIMSKNKPDRPLKCDVTLHIRVYFGDKRKRDVHGHLKALIDCLSGIVIEDDVQVFNVDAEKYYDKENPRVEIEVL